MVLVQAVGVLRKKNTTVGEPKGLEESAELIDLVKSVEEVKENGEDVLRRTRNPRK